MDAAARLAVCGLLDRMKPADLAVLEPALMLSVRREYRLRQRDRAIILLAGEYLGPLWSGRAISQAMAADLRRYRARKTFEQGRRRLIARVLCCSQSA